MLEVRGAKGRVRKRSPTKGGPGKDFQDVHCVGARPAAALLSSPVAGPSPPQPKGATRGVTLTPAPTARRRQDAERPRAVGETSRHAQGPFRRKREGPGRELRPCWAPKSGRRGRTSQELGPTPAAFAGPDPPSPSVEGRPSWGTRSPALPRRPCTGPGASGGGVGTRGGRPLWPVPRGAEGPASDVRRPARVPWSVPPSGTDAGVASPERRPPTWPGKQGIRTRRPLGPLGLARARDRRHTCRPLRRARLGNRARDRAAGVPERPRARGRPDS